MPSANIIQLRQLLSDKFHGLRLLLRVGATAAQALLGKDFKVSKRRGELLESELAGHAMATVHPSSILRGAGR